MTEDADSEAKIPPPEPPPPQPESKLRRFWPIIPLGLILLALMLEDLHVMGWSPFETDSCGVAELDQSSFSAKLYNPLAEWGVHHTGNPQVAILYIDAATEPPELLTNTCASRVFLARLVGDLNKLNPNVIVIDKFYTEAACGEGDKNTIFKTALGKSNAPVVIGQPTHPLTSSMSEGCIGLSPGMKFDPKANVRIGLTRLNADTLQVPTRWPVFNDLDNPSAPPVLQGPNAGDTLSLVAARAQWPGIDTSPAMAKLLDAGTHPYTTFLDLPNLHAMTVICSVEAKPLYADGTPVPCDQKKWKQDPNSLDGKQLSLKGKVVVIGDVTEGDMQPFPTQVQSFPSGQVPGVYLQANYIESLLDQRFLTQTPTWVTVTFLMVFVIGNYCLYWAHNKKGKPLLSLEKALIGSVILLGCMLVLALAALLGFDYFTPVWALWGAGFFLVFRYLESSGHHRSQQLMGEIAGAHSEGPAHQPEVAPAPPEEKG